MADRDLRQLERLKDNSPEARAAWLRERIRVGDECRHPEPPEGVEWEFCPACGDLSLAERVELGAWCGEPVALEEWAEGLSRFGRPVSVRAGWAAGVACVEKWEAEQFREWSVRGKASATEDRLMSQIFARKDPTPRKILDSVAQWFACPCPHHSEEASLEAITTILERIAGWASGPALLISTYESPVVLARVLDQVSDAAAYLDDEQAVRDAISAELIRWALG